MIIIIDSAPAMFVSAETVTLLEDKIIYVTWPDTRCASMYQLIITSGSMEETVTTTSTEFIYTIPAYGCYIFKLSSIDYFGRSVGVPVSTKVCFKCESFLILTLIVVAYLN